VNKTLKIVAVVAVALTASVAQAQPYRPGGDRDREPSATLFEGPNFQGRQITVRAYGDNLDDMNFNDIAQSARFQGRWRVCENSKYRGKCQDVSGQVADLNALGMGLRISSLQGYFEGAWSRNGGWDRGGGYGGGGYGRDRPFEGATGVLFPYPSLAGFDIAAGGSSASAFCRSVGLGSSAYYDSSERAPRALDGEGRYTGDTSVLRDVFCRRR
jgi:hypothetical protein